MGEFQYGNAYDNKWKVLFKNVFPHTFTREYLIPSLISRASIISALIPADLCRCSALPLKKNVFHKFHVKRFVTQVRRQIMWPGKMALVGLV